MNPELGVKALEHGSLVQISPESDAIAFRGCILTVTEVKPWGIKGYVQVIGNNKQEGGQAYLRMPYEDIAYVGRALWVWEDKGD